MSAYKVASMNKEGEGKKVFKWILKKLINKYIEQIKV